ncbi:MAG: NAD(+)/NADH kinase [Deltaproteobacteria bacterium]|nr:NAD(+)/NADH kinase [Deltaproteobacteria bacterium]
MDHVAIIYKRARPEAAELASKLASWLQNRHIDVFCRENVGSADITCDVPAIEIPPENQLVIVIGGDGTFLSVARFLCARSTPIVGINLGGLGFLTEVTTADCCRELERILAGDFIIEERMRLRVVIMREGREYFSHSVLNDVVINKGALARIIELKTTIDGHYLTHYRADGLIVATPTGSTAYNLSAGGPIMVPSAHAIILTPICPFTLANRPLILPAHVTVSIEPEGQVRRLTLSCDGQVGCALTPSDRIVICADANPVRCVKTPSVDYFEILRSKLKWGQN